ncbi:sugar transferase [Paenibacillus camelliae]|uniref:sugar transferase n=1 Tax=Paenibacillus camelliae TaxID=512410 RepID=UPI002041CEAE|nr:sugar transferase [Paenibacillus camelliae]MCM3633965.1 sugar transferase [Paenibacillus camelliae]
MYAKYIKRLIDIIISLILFPLLLLLVVVVGILIKLEDRGPVFYKGTRLGQYQKEYKMYKFRSMIVDAPDIRNTDGSTFNSIQDPRQTKIGRILRKTSLDEVPQIINVIKGDMSLVGPRPSPLGNEHTYDDEYKLKFNVKPGITGFSQAYYRNSIDSQEKKKYDVYYSENLSFKLDIRIILKTIGTVFNRKGIYTNNDNSTNVSRKGINK